jgi:hypothetical protein
LDVVLSFVEDGDVFSFAVHFEEGDAASFSAGEENGLHRLSSKNENRKRELIYPRSFGRFLQ